MEFVSWGVLSSQAGSLAMVVVITQFTKNIKFISKIPTQLWSFFVALAVIYPAYYFTGKLSSANAFLVPLNAVITSLSASGGFSALNRAFPSAFAKSCDLPAPQAVSCDTDAAGTLEEKQTEKSESVKQNPSAGLPERD